ncbi:unnamed protein product [Soboliphyme baturini]|uniref:Endo/exonuclease/phosphatase domain-containing protein n=1 Tax=Soboliphyme baturini TaxID=241478 RepID=A0A183ID50_9BILA|nr:unnamed protein product [Soboliphyme baturini]
MKREEEGERLRVDLAEPRAAFDACVMSVLHLQEGSNRSTKKSDFQKLKICKKKLCVACWNLRTLNSDGKLDVVTLAAEGDKLDILGLPEIYLSDRAIQHLKMEGSSTGLVARILAAKLKLQFCCLPFFERRTL